MDASRYRNHCTGVLEAPRDSKNGAKLDMLELELKYKTLRSPTLCTHLVTIYHWKQLCY